MKQTTPELALLESALVAIEKVLAHAEAGLQGNLYRGPTANVPLEALGMNGSIEGEGYRASAAHSAIHICLSSAAALVDVSQAMMTRHGPRSAQELEQEWHALVTHTKMASRSAYRAALIMASQMNVLQAQRSATPDIEAPFSLTH